MPNENEKPTIRADLPLAVSPMMLLPHRSVLDKPGTPGSRAFGAAEVAMRTMHDALGDMTDVKKYVTSTATPTGEVVHLNSRNGEPAGNYQVNGQEESLREAMSRSFGRAGEVVDRQRKAIEASVADIEKSIAAKLVNPNADKTSVSQVASEIREHVKSMKPGDRTDFFHRAVMDGDLETVAAILDASPFVSGFDRKQHAELRIFAAQYFPATKGEFEQLGAVRAVLSKVESAGGAFVSKYADLQPPQLKSGKGEAAKKIAALAAGGK
ncbi:MAG: hypothetical protein Q8M24_08395 [Pseudolabrys sp.]|nr:hypothetical protein [Pseudolabrys sp.]MDP2295466.1 hypothetical protein [Pseudolabrys sp.]